MFQHVCKDFFLDIGKAGFMPITLLFNMIPFQYHSRRQFVVQYAA